MLGLAGVAEMDDRVAEFTVRVVLPEIFPEVAVMVVPVPTATAVARPLLFTVAIDVLDELQVTCAVISRLVPSENVPVAVNGWVTPTGILGLAGVTAMEDRGGAFTVRIVLPNELLLEKLLGSLEVAVMVVVPKARGVARPLLSTVATDGSEELQVTCVVISWVVWSL
jgi:hypothetical protein